MLLTTRLRTNAEACVAPLSSLTDVSCQHRDVTTAHGCQSIGVTRACPTLLRRPGFILLASLASLLAAPSASACAQHSYSGVACLPGFALLGGHVGFALAILAAFIERPFLTWAGVDRRTVAYSIQANLLSLLGTGFTGLVAASTLWYAGDIAVLWIPLAVVLNAAIEFA
jgi:hypothetical protein